eukprot:CAMPEP_0182453764 /NCGR_PEP_ID=MMETSP1319-20130603/691_1 /TAXON_ID=172717 /ORGANISM="Bolidomonas pacifica, Strain RCC208" /LENGTH=92 /DNA_ID=CAMNT_0024651719 /DNA_START=24 /DNA_END=299 /DNA_ORIENTATION=-
MEALSAAIVTSITTTLTPSDPSQTRVEIDLEGSCEEGSAKVTMSIVSAAFSGLPRLRRHKLVNSCMAPFLESGGGVHAVSFKCKSLEEEGGG